MSDSPQHPQLLKRISQLFSGDSSPQSQPLFDMVATLITSTYDLDTLVNSSRDMLHRELGSSYVKIVLMDRTELLFFNSVGKHEEKMYPNDIPRLEATNPPRIAKLDELPDGELKKWMTGFGIALLYKLEVRGNRVGYLFLGNKETGEKYSPENLETLSIVVEQLAVAFANALAVRRISAFNEELKLEIEKATKELAKANEDLKQLDKLKDEFVSMASHELKSPLNAVKNFLWLAINKGKEEPGKMDEYLNVAFKATEQVLFLVNDLLDVSRIESGRIQLNIEAVALHELVTETGKIYENLMAEKGLSFTLEIDPALMVKADLPRLREVFSNFISNAAKYTIKGSITVKAVVNGDMVTCSVSDTGVGISKEDQAKLFDKFSRLKNNAKELANVEGTGLGLYITKKLVELMGGTLGIESEVGKGSSFWFTIPKA
jgi:signal transduction histidine kinase